MTLYNRIVGFINLTRLRQTGRPEQANNQLPTSLLSLRNH